MTLLKQSTVRTILVGPVLDTDGAGSGYDADLLDGQEGIWYSDAANLTGTLSGASVPAAQLTGNIAAARTTNALSGMAGTNLDWNGSSFNLDAAA